MTGQRPPTYVCAEVEIDEELVRALLRAQLPARAAQPLRWLATGWDNVIYRLGSDALLRLPRRAVADEMLALELTWLPHLAPRLPVSVPTVLHRGQPGPGYPFRWGLVGFIEGQVAARAALDASAFARQLGVFLGALHQPAPADAPGNLFRGVHPAARRHRVHEYLPDLAALVETDALLRLWEEACAAPAWSGPPTWCHGDLHPFNLLVREGRLVAVLDWGDLHAGEPAPDLASLWLHLDPEHHPAVLAAAGGYDPQTLQRGRAWALYLGIMLAHAGLEGSGERYLEAGVRTLHRLIAAAPV